MNILPTCLQRKFSLAVFSRSLDFHTRHNLAIRVELMNELLLTTRLFKYSIHSHLLAHVWCERAKKRVWCESYYMMST